MRATDLRALEAKKSARPKRAAATTKAALAQGAAAKVATNADPGPGHQGEVERRGH